MIDFDNPVKTEITSDKINFKSWSIYPIHQYHKYRFYSLCKSAPLYLKRRKIRLNLTNLQIKAVTSLYLNGLFGFAANTNRNNSLSFDGYVASEKGEEAFVEIDYKDDSLECVRRILGDIIRYSDTHKIKNGIVVLSRLPQIGSRDVYNLLEKMKKFPTTNDISIYMTTFSHLRAIYLYKGQSALCSFEDVFYNPIKEDICAYQKKVENLFTDIIPPLFDEI